MLHLHASSVIHGVTNLNNILRNHISNIVWLLQKPEKYCVCHRYENVEMQIRFTDDICFHSSFDFHKETVTIN